LTFNVVVVANKKNVIVTFAGQYALHLLWMEDMLTLWDVVIRVLF
jgi:hypothetical protein